MYQKLDNHDKHDVPKIKDLMKHKTPYKLKSRIKHKIYEPVYSCLFL